ncbi:MAG: thioredoxin family protein [Nannocystaceae bacterium]
MTPSSTRRSWAALVLSCALGCTSSQSDPDQGEKVAKTPPASGAAEPAGKQATPAKQVATAESHGFNDQIAWRGLDEGFAEAKKSGRPLMLLVHASWCPKCKKLKPSFNSSALTELSRKFVMVNADQDLSPEVEVHAPDGNYVPRILFFEPGGTLDSSIQNPGRNRFRYFYMPHDDLVGTMKQALERHAPNL